jgi:hypothetical protein
MGNPKSRRYTDPELRSLIFSLVDSRRVDGVAWWKIAEETGISQQALERIYEEEARQKAPNNGSTNGHSKPLALHGLEKGTSNLVLITPAGHRIEGLDVETLARLLARLHALNAVH